MPPPRHLVWKEGIRIVDAYFDDCDKNNKPYTVAGLCAFLKITKEYFMNYKDTNLHQYKYARAFRQAKRRILAYAEEQLMAGKLSSAGYKIFIEQNFGGGEKSNETRIKIID